jgi:hypothetical protein
MTWHKLVEEYLGGVLRDVPDKTLAMEAVQRVPHPLNADIFGRRLWLRLEGNSDAWCVFVLQDVSQDLYLDSSKCATTSISLQ